MGDKLVKDVVQIVVGSELVKLILEDGSELVSGVEEYVTKRLEEAQIHINSNDFESLDKTLDEILEISPDNFFAIRNKTMLLTRNNDMQAAINLFERTFGRERSDVSRADVVDFYLNYVDVLITGRDYDSARRVLDEVDRISIGNQQTHVKYAKMDLDQGRFESALEILEKISPEIHNYTESRIYKTLAHLGLRQTFNAEETLNLVPNGFLKKAYTQGILMMMVGHADESVRFFKESLEENPGEFGAYMMLSQLYLQMGRIDYADELALKGLEQNSAIYEMDYVRGAVMLHRKEYGHAVNFMLNVIANNIYRKDFVRLLIQEIYETRSLEKVVNGCTERFESSPALLNFNTSLFLAQAFKSHGLAVPEKITRYVAETLRDDPDYLNKLEKEIRTRFSQVSDFGVIIAKGAINETAEEIKQLRNEFIIGRYITTVMNAVARTDGVGADVAQVFGFEQTAEGKHVILQQTVDKQSLKDIIKQSSDDEIITAYKRAIRSMVAVVAYGTKYMQIRGNDHFIETSDGKKDYTLKLEPYPLWDNALERLMNGRNDDVLPRLGRDPRYAKQNKEMMGWLYEYISTALDPNVMKYFVHGDYFAKNVDLRGEIFDFGRGAVGNMIQDPPVLTSDLRPHMIRDQNFISDAIEYAYQLSVEFDLRPNNAIFKHHFERLLAFSVILNIGSSMGAGDAKQFEESIETAMVLLDQQKRNQLRLSLYNRLNAYAKEVVFPKERITPPGYVH